LIAITSDIDWSPDYVIDYFLEILDKYSIKSTFFCTHKVTIKNHELGIHPNFSGTKDDKKLLKNLLRLFPKAKGVRAHRLMNYSPLYSLYKEFNLQYDSSYIIPLTSSKPFTKYPGILEIPMSFEDDLYFSNISKTFKINELGLNRKNLFVFNFHPIHIFLNTNSIQHYQKSKIFLHNSEKLNSCRSDKRGTRDLLVELLEYISKNNIETLTLKQINNTIRKKNKIETKRYS